MTNSITDDKEVSYDKTPLKIFQDRCNATHIKSQRMFLSLKLERTSFQQWIKKNSHERFYLKIQLEQSSFTNTKYFKTLVFTSNSVSKRL